MQVRHRVLCRPPPVIGLSCGASLQGTLCRPRVETGRRPAGYDDEARADPPTPLCVIFVFTPLQSPSSILYPRSDIHVADHPSPAPVSVSMPGMSRSFIPAYWQKAEARSYADISFHVFGGICGRPEVQPRAVFANWRPRVSEPSPGGVGRAESFRVLELQFPLKLNMYTPTLAT